MNLEELRRSRAIYIFESINEVSAKRVIEELLYLDSLDHEANISLYINSYGGEVLSFLAIYDVMQYIKPKIMTLCVGKACSAAAMLLLSGSDNSRYALPNSRIMLHGVASGTRGTLLEMQNWVKENEILQSTIDSILLKHTKLTKKEIENIKKQDFYYSAQEAKKHKIIDEVR